MSESELTTWKWVTPAPLDEELYYRVDVDWQQTLITEAGRAVDGAACEADKRIAAACHRDDAPEAWRRDRALRRRAQMEVTFALFALYSEMGIDAPESAGVVLAEIVADAATVARLYGWEPGRERIPGRLRTEVYKRDGYACVECRADDITQLTIDHRIPVSLGGGNDLENLRTLCKPCNSRKGARV